MKSARCPRLLFLLGLQRCMARLYVHSDGGSPLPAQKLLVQQAQELHRNMRAKNSTTRARTPHGPIRLEDHPVAKALSTQANEGLPRITW